jgi:hypothetical protein
MNNTPAQVIFCGENPEIRLVRPEDVDAEIAFASYWQCSYSPYGSGQLLALHIEPNMLEKHLAALTLIVADNAVLGRMVVNDLVQHFPGLGHIPFTEISVETGNLSQVSDGQKNLRIECRTAQYHIEITWADVLDVRLPHTYANFISEAERGTALDVSNVICPVGGGGIVIDGAAVKGKVHSFHDGTMHRSTAFLAFSETWVRHALP